MFNLRMRKKDSKSEQPDIGECLTGLQTVYYGSQDSVELLLDDGPINTVEKTLLKQLNSGDSDDDHEELLDTPSYSASKIGFNLNSPNAFPCADTNKELPSNPSQWPQAPLMIRPTPHSKTKIRGIRRVRSRDYESFSGVCAGCILPINTGQEAPGESLVVDFESPLFEGTLLLRLKQASSINESTQLSESYFDGKKRKFQAVVRGRFRKPVPIYQCVTGQSFDRPAGRLPAKWICTTFIKFISTLAPQLQAKLDGEKPRFLSPLVATAQTVLQRPLDDATARDDGIDSNLEEPPSEKETSLLFDLTTKESPNSVAVAATSTSESSSISARMKARKKAMNTVFAKQYDDLMFDTNKEYTFEFYQHLLDFGPEQLAVDMGRAIGKLPLAEALDGQPIKFMSLVQQPDDSTTITEEEEKAFHLAGESCLWSFDIWHSCLFPYAERSLSLREKKQ